MIASAWLDHNDGHGDTVFDGGAAWRFESSVLSQSEMGRGHC